jgi:hypothetical protein
MAKKKSDNLTEPVICETVVKPLVSIQGHTHKFTELDMKDELPDLTAIGICKLSKPEEGRRNDWVSYTVKTKGRQIVSLEVSEADHKAIAEENHRMAFVALFMDAEGLV